MGSRVLGSGGRFRCSWRRGLGFMPSWGGCFYSEVVVEDSD